MSSRSPITKRGKKSPARYEVWLRVECPDRTCGFWTFVPGKNKTGTVKCTVCGKVRNMGKLLKEGVEWNRR